MFLLYLIDLYRLHGPPTQLRYLCDVLETLQYIKQYIKLLLFSSNMRGNLKKCDRYVN